MSEKTPDSAPEQVREENGKHVPSPPPIPPNAGLPPLVATYADAVTCSRLKDVEYLTFFQPIVPPTGGDHATLMPVAQIVLTARTSEALARILADHNGLTIVDAKDSPAEGKET